jgi:hypothetical protein
MDANKEANDDRMAKEKRQKGMKRSKHEKY